MNAQARKAFLFALLVCLTGQTAIAADETLVFGDPDEMQFEWRVRQALRQPLSLHYKELPFSEVATDLQQRLGVPVKLDIKALEDAGAGLDTPITFECENLAGRDAIRLMLGALDLTWVNQQVLLITTPEKAGSELVVRVYPVADLITLPADEYGLELGFDFDSLIELITSTVEPTTWDAVGGPGSISPFEPSAAIVFNQTRDVHEKVESLLFTLRAARDSQGLPVFDAAIALEQERRRQGEMWRQYNGDVQQQSSASDFSGGGFFHVSEQSHPNEDTQESAESIEIQSWQQPRRHE